MVFFSLPDEGIPRGPISTLLYWELEYGRKSSTAGIIWVDLHWTY